MIKLDSWKFCVAFVSALILIPTGVAIFGFDLPGHGNANASLPHETVIEAYRLDPDRNPCHPGTRRAEVEVIVVLPSFTDDLSGSGAIFAPDFPVGAELRSNSEQTNAGRRAKAKKVKKVKALKKYIKAVPSPSWDDQKL